MNPYLTSYARPAVTDIPAGLAVSDDGIGSSITSSNTQAVRGISVGATETGLRPSVAAVGADVPFVAGAGGCTIGDTLIVESGGTGRLVAITEVGANLVIVGTCTANAIDGGTGRLTLKVGTTVGDGGLSGIWLITPTGSTEYTGALALPNAVSAAVSGNYIKVGPGQYLGHFTIPAGVEVQGSAQSVIVPYLPTIPTVTLEDEGLLTNITVVTSATSAATPAVSWAGTGVGAVVQNVSIFGGGSGTGVKASGTTGTLAILGLYFIGGTMAGHLAEYVGGHIETSVLGYSRGNCTSILALMGGTSETVTISGDPAAAYTVPKRIVLSGGTHTISGVQIGGIGDGICVTADGGKLVGSGVTMEDSLTNHVCISGGLVGTGSRLVLSGHMDRDKWNVPPAWFVEAQGAATFLDSKANGDESQVFWAEVAIGMPGFGFELIVGQGDSYTTLMGVWTRTAAGVFVDISPAASSHKDSLFTFPGIAADNCIYVFSKFPVVGGFHHPWGHKIHTEIAVVLGSGEIVAEYFNDTGIDALNTSWTDFATEWRDADAPYAGNGHRLFQRVDKEQVRFDTTVKNSVPLGNPIGLAGDDYYCMRYRIKTAITTSPSIQQIKLHTDRWEANKDGFTEGFGAAMHIGTFPMHINMFKPGASSPSNTDLYVSPSIRVGFGENSFSGTADNESTYADRLPGWVMTASPLFVTLDFIQNGTNGADVQWKVIRAITSAGGIVATTSGPVAAVPELPVTKVVSITADADKLFSVTFEMDIRMARAEAPGQIGDIIAILLSRLGSADANGDRSILYNVSAQAVAWSQGRAIDP